MKIISVRCGVLSYKLWIREALESISPQQHRLLPLLLVVHHSQKVRLSSAKDTIPSGYRIQRNQARTDLENSAVHLACYDRDLPAKQRCAFQFSSDTKVQGNFSLTIRFQACSTEQTSLQIWQLQMWSRVQSLGGQDPKRQLFCFCSMDMSIFYISSH